MSANISAKPLPGIFISKEAVNDRVKNFLLDKHRLLSQAMGKPETKSAWYSLEQFEELVEEMRLLQADGLRIYFGSYAADIVDVANHLTIIFVPTRLDESSQKHKDIVLEDEQDFPERLAATDRKNLDTAGLCPPGCDEHDPYYPYEY